MIGVARMNIFTALFSKRGRAAMRYGIAKEIVFRELRRKNRWDDLDSSLFARQIEAARGCDDEWLHENVMMNAGLYNGRLPGRGYPASGPSLSGAAQVVLLERYEALKSRQNLPT